MYIWTATGADAAAIAGLTEQLGYSAGTKLIAHKLGVRARSADEAVFLAIDSYRVIGCLKAHVHELFHALGRLGRITALVIDDKARGSASTFTAPYSVKL